MMGLGFLAPAVLAGLIALPILWWLLRAIPPAPRTALFPGVRLLLGLEDPEREAERTPWWLLALRIAAVAAVILGFAQPILNPSERLSAGGDGPVLLLMDAGWASGPDWADRLTAAGAAIDEAAADGRSVILWRAAERRVAPPPQMPAVAARAALDGSEPLPLRPDRLSVLTLLDDPAAVQPGETVWLHDGLGHDAEATEALAERLLDFGPLHVVGPAGSARAVLPPRLEEGKLISSALRAGGPGDAGPASETLVAIATVTADDGAAAGERRIAVAEAAFEPGETATEAVFDLPSELIGSIARITLADDPTPGGTSLADGAVRRVRVAVVDPASEGEVIRLTSAQHYLTKALVPHAEVHAVTLAEAVDLAPAAIFLADQGEMGEEVEEALAAWVDDGGLLVRFAGPRLAGAVAAAAMAPGAAAAPGAGLGDLLPVRLRRGGRTLGGALAWGDPRSLGPFAAEGPFRRLERPDEVEVRTQVLAQPTPDLAGRVWASLDDGTPLVTAADRGDGRVVLFHVSADAEWSSLPLSGLFVDMLRELIALAPGSGGNPPTEEELSGTLWRLDQTLARDGTLLPVPANRDPVAGERLAATLAGEDGPAGDLMPGIYLRADGGPRATGAAETLVVNLYGEGDSLTPSPRRLPARSSIVLEGRRR
ncbi:MAG: BatA domain-containing protein [Pseudomonadota bacterium]